MERRLAERQGVVALGTPRQGLPAWSRARAPPVFSHATSKSPTQEGEKRVGGGKMRRAAIGLLALSLVVVASLVATAGGGARDDSATSGDDHVFIRWDLVQFVGGVILVGGSDVSTDAETGDTVKLTGSGHAEPLEHEAAGGGTFVHKNEDGKTLAKGAYYVTDFRGWERLDGGR